MDRQSSKREREKEKKRSISDIQRKRYEGIQSKRERFTKRESLKTENQEE